MKHDLQLIELLQAQEQKLSRDLRSLEVFVGTGGYGNLPGNHKALIAQQMRHMRNYWHVLCQRIRLMKEENEAHAEMRL